MHIAPEFITPTTTSTTSTIINRQQQLTPAPSVDGDISHNKLDRQRSYSDPSRDDDYYFYHKGMTSRRSSIQSIGRRPEDERRESNEQVRLPPITSLLAAVEPPNPYATPRDPRDPQTPHYVSDPREIMPYPRDPTMYPREHPAPPPPPQHYSLPPPPEPMPPYPYSTPPTSYPYHLPYRRQSIFSAYSSSTSSSPRAPPYAPPPTSQPLPPYRTPSPPYRPYPPPPPIHHYPPPPPPAHLQPRPQPPSAYIHTISTRQPPGSFALTHRTNSASPAERYMCPECNKSFSRPSSLRIHTFSHTGEKPFVCPEPGCTKRFSVRSNMRRHMKVHTEQAEAAGLGEGVEEGEGEGEGEMESAEGREEDVISENSGSPPIRPRQEARSSI